MHPGRTLRRIDPVDSGPTTTRKGFALVLLILALLAWFLDRWFSIVLPFLLGLLGRLTHRPRRPAAAAVTATPG